MTKLSMTLALIASLAGVAPAAAWQSSRSTSPIDDSATISIRQEARDTYANRYGDVGRANLQILCERNTTGIAIVFPELYTSDIGGLGKVTFRADRDQAFTVQMHPTNDRAALMLISGEAIRTIKQFVNAEALFAQTLTVSEPSVQVEFDLSGLTEAIAPIRETCGW